MSAFLFAEEIDVVRGLRGWGRLWCLLLLLWRVFVLQRSTFSTSGLQRGLLHLSLWHHLTIWKQLTLRLTILRHHVLSHAVCRQRSWELRPSRRGTGKLHQPGQKPPGLPPHRNEDGHRQAQVTGSYPAPPPPKGLENQTKVKPTLFLFSKQKLFKCSFFVMRVVRPADTITVTRTPRGLLLRSWPPPWPHPQPALPLHPCLRVSVRREASAPPPDLWRPRRAISLTTRRRTLGGVSSISRCGRV